MHARIGATERRFLLLVAALARRESWVDEGARDLAHLLSMRYGISCWKARRWIDAAHALERLPRLSDALETGELSLDKVAELARFAAPETEAGLIRWAAEI